MKAGDLFAYGHGRQDIRLVHVMTWPLPWLCDRADRRPGFFAIRMFIAGYVIVVLGSVGSIALFHRLFFAQILYLFLAGFYVLMGVLALPNMRAAALVTEKDPTSISLGDLLVLHRLIGWRKYDCFFLVFMVFLLFVIPTLWTASFLVGWSIRWISLYWGTVFYSPMAKAKAPAKALQMAPVASS